MKKICKDACRVAGAVQETCSSERLGPGADFLRGGPGAVHCTRYTTPHHNYNCNYALCYATLHDITTTTTKLLFHVSLNYTRPPYSTQHYSTLRYTTCHFTTFITPHHNYNCNYNYTTLITLHYNYNSTTLQLELQLHYNTLQPAVVGEVTTASIASTPKSTTPTTFPSISGIALPSMHHNNSPLL